MSAAAEGVDWWACPSTTEYRNSSIITGYLAVETSICFWAPRGAAAVRGPATSVVAVAVPASGTASGLNCADISPTVADDGAPRPAPHTLLSSLRCSLGEIRDVGRFERGHVRTAARPGCMRTSRGTGRRAPVLRKAPRSEEVLVTSGRRAVPGSRPTSRPFLITSRISREVGWSRRPWRSQVS